ncbi:MAG: hypothetical protein AB1428_03945 [Bacteroidota bacterium]
MTRLAVLISLGLVLAFTADSPAQSKRETGSQRTGKKEPTRTGSQKTDRGPERRPAKDSYEPLPHEPPITRPVDVIYPPIMIAPPAPPPPPIAILDPPPMPEIPFDPDRRGERRVTQVELSECLDNPASAGYSFADARIVSCEDSTVDLYLSIAPPDSFYFMVPQDNDIKDLGRIRTYRAAAHFRPTDWLDAHAVLIAEGHTYVVWTYTGDFYLVRVRDIRDRRVFLEWIWHSRLSRHTAAEAEERQKEREREREKRREELGPYFGK